MSAWISLKYKISR